MAATFSAMAIQCINILSQHLYLVALIFTGITGIPTLYSLHNL